MMGKERNWMKILSAGNASAGALVLLLALGAAGCGKDDDHNANNSNTARNANTATTSTPLATPTPAVSTSEDTAIKNKTEAALSKAGVSGVTVEVKGGEVTLKGDVAKAKWPDAMKAANESGAKKVNNQLNDKK
jgi:osmotically-inducible protein OsmY